jgi:ABC-type multidrug transport system permease subunit
MAERASLHPLLELTRARILGFIREPGSLFWVFGFPILLAVALGAAFRTKPPETFRAAVVASAEESASLDEALTEAAQVEITYFEEPSQARAALGSGKIDVIAEIDGSTDSPKRLRYIFDPTQPRGPSARLALDNALQGALGRYDAVGTEDLEMTERGSRYIDFLLPGLIGLNIMGSSMWGLGFVLVMARVRKLLKRLAATPMRRSHYLLAMGLARMVYLVLELTALLVFGRLVFDVAVAGSLASLAVIVALGAACFTGLALLVGARATSIETASGLMNFTMLPMWVLSGSFFSYDRFPEIIQPAIRLLPLTALNDGLRAVINDGAPLIGIWQEALVLALWAALSFAVALRIFKWQ